MFTPKKKTTKKNLPVPERLDWLSVRINFKAWLLLFCSLLVSYLLFLFSKTFYHLLLCLFFGVCVCACVVFLSFVRFPSVASIARLSFCYKFWCVHKSRTGLRGLAWPSVLLAIWHDSTLNSTHNSWCVYFLFEYNIYISFFSLVWFGCCLSYIVCIWYAKSLVSYIIQSDVVVVFFLFFYFDNFFCSILSFAQ